MIQEQKAPELKPCPFCGADAELFGGKYAACTETGCEACFSDISDVRFTPEEWNTRADLSPPAVTVKPLVWMRRGDGVYSAGYEKGHFYEVCSVGSGRWIATNVIHGLGRWIGPLTHHTKHAAQAAAQADHQRRWESITPPNPSPRKWRRGVLLAAIPNPIFDGLKAKLMSEFKIPYTQFDEDGEEINCAMTVDWTTIKEIITDALRAIKEGE